MTAVLSVAGFESQHPAWMAADQGWIKRADKGVGVRGGPKRTPTAYFYNGWTASSGFVPYGRSWGAIAGGGGCASPSPSPSASFDPCASLDPGASLDPSASPIICPSPSQLPKRVSSSVGDAGSTAPPTPTHDPDAHADPAAANAHAGTHEAAGHADAHPGTHEAAGHADAHAGTHADTDVRGTAWLSRPLPIAPSNAGCRSAFRPPSRRGPREPVRLGTRRAKGRLSDLSAFRPMIRAIVVARDRPVYWCQGEGTAVLSPH